MRFRPDNFIGITVPQSFSKRNEKHLNQNLKPRPNDQREKS